VRIRLAIRDEVDSPTSALAVKFKAVSETLGYPVTFAQEWPMIWSEFQSNYPDNATFIPSVIAAVVAWCDAFVDWLERDENQDSVDKVIDGLGTKGRMQLLLKVRNAGFWLQ
jgi:hypothetical protein